MELRHRLPGVFMKIPPLWLPGKKGNKKALIPKLTLGTRTENKIFCGTTLFAAEATTSCRCQHIRCQITPALRQKILGFCLSLCPRRPIYRYAYRPALSVTGLSVGATPGFTSASSVSELTCSQYTTAVSVCQALFFADSGHFFCRIFRRNIFGEKALQNIQETCDLLAIILFIRKNQANRCLGERGHF